MSDSKLEERNELQRQASEIEARAAKEAQRLRDQAAAVLCKSPGCSEPADEDCYGKCSYHWFWGSGF